MTIEFLRKLVRRSRARANRSRATRVGEGTQLDGTIDRRAAGAEINIGAHCLIQGQIVVERDESQVDLADRVLLGGGSVIDCALAVTVERNVLISYGCIIADSDTHSLFPELRVNDLATWMDGRRHDWSHSEMAPIRICEGAWIGARSIILKGVTIGAGAVVGMGSVVTRNVPARTVVGGNPARVIREIGPAPGARPSSDMDA
jgi:acetyltransferase-like isoleucine patch superfamily enzyme